MTKTPNRHTSGYFAVRSGKAVRKCIFLDWEDCEEHVDEYDEAEYNIFDSVQEAVDYLKPAAKVPPSPTETAQIPSEIKADTEGDANKEDAPELTATTLPEAALAPIVGADDEAKLLVSLAAQPSESRPKKRRRIVPPAVSTNHDISARVRKPTKRWEDFFEQLLACRQPDGTLQVDPANSKLKRWIEDQHYHYKRYCEGQPSAMFDEKINRLQSAGFVFRMDANKVKKEPIAKSGTRVHKKWEEWCDKLKVYMDTHDGSCVVPKNDEENSKLRKWILEQQSEYRKLQEGRESLMTEGKAQRLVTLGFEFTHVSWNERIEQLRAFKAEHGDSCDPEKHEVLGKWMMSICRQIKAVAAGKPSRDLTPQRLEQLRALGFGSGKMRHASKIEECNKEFEVMMEKLREFKAQHGDCKVRRNEPHIELHNWVTRQRLEYKKLQAGKPSRMTAHRLQRLTDIGFAFWRRNYQPWEERLDQLKEFKAAHGHLRVPVSNPVLGEFVARQRVEYRQRQEGVKSAMTDERIRTLEELGFEWQIGTRKGSNMFTKLKTWEERFQELLTFREETGHTVVPQHTPGLGSWVHKQRKDYKDMMKGNKTPMTAEKALKLANVGFVFDVFELKRRRRSSNVDGPASSDEE